MVALAAAVQTDYDLLTGWKSGDLSAGNRLFERHFDSVYRFYKNKVDGPVEDLVQEVFAACITGRDRFKGASSFRTYLFSIARRKLFDFYRTKGRSVDFTTASVVDLGGSPSAALMHRQEQKLLLTALRAIPLEFQIALELYYWEGLKGPELAQVLDINANTVRSRLHRARKAVEEAMQQLADGSHTLEATVSNLDTWAYSIKDLLAAS